MREFIVLGHTAPVTSEFSLDDLAGSAGRLDVLCRCVNAGFVLSHAIRRDIHVRLVIQDAVTICLVGNELRYLSPDERNIASLLRTALDARETVVGHMEVESTPGVYVSNRGLEAALKDRTDVTFVQLHEAGSPIHALDHTADTVFVVADHEDFTTDETKILEDVIDKQVSVGPVSVHADHAITVVQNYFDTAGYSQYAP